MAAAAEVVEVAEEELAQGVRNGEAANGLDTQYPALIGADHLHDYGIDGRGVTIAVLDTGLWTGDEQVAQALGQTPDGHPRILAKHDAVTGPQKFQGSDTFSLAGDTVSFEMYGGTYGGTYVGSYVGTDGNGHGTHVASVAVSSLYAGMGDRVRGKSDENGKGVQLGTGENYNGIAPAANLVVVKAFDDNRRHDRLGGYQHLGVTGVGTSSSKGVVDPRQLGSSS